MKNIAMRISRIANGKRVAIAHVAMRSVAYGATKLHLSSTVPPTSSTPVTCTHQRERIMY